MKTFAVAVILFGLVGANAQDAVSAPLLSEVETEQARQVLARNGALEPRVHDPSSIVRCQDEYWFFATGNGISSWRSKDLKQWEAGPRVFPEMPAWVKDIVPTQRRKRM